MADDGRISISLQLGQAVNQLKQLSGGLEDVDQQAKKTNKTLAGLQTAARWQTTYLGEINKTAKALVASYQEQTAAINKLIAAQTNLSAASGKVQKSMSGLDSTISRMLPTIISVAGAWKVFTTTLGVSVKMDSLQKTFYAIQGSMTGAGAEMDYLRKKSQELGLDFMALAESYKGFSAAAKFANFDMSTTRDMFNSVAESATVLGLSGEKTKLVLMALEQMISKGTVSMEELRRQLGDSLPGAFELGAKAMNMTLQEFNKLVASGKLMSEEFLPKFSKALRENYATIENVGLAVKTPRAEIQKLMNEILFAEDQFSRVGFLETVKQGVVDLRTALEKATADGTVARLGEQFGILVTLAMKATQFLLENADAISRLVAVMATLYAADKAYVAIQAVKLANWSQMGVVLPTIIKGFKGMEYGLLGLTNSFAAARLGAIALTGALTFGIGALAMWAVPEVISWLTGFSKESSVAKDYAAKFGTTVAEAEMQISKFMVTLGKSDPYATFDKTIIESTELLKKMGAAADEAMGKASKAAGEGWMERMGRDALRQDGMSEEEIEKMWPSKALTEPMIALKKTIQDTYKSIKEGTYQTSVEIMAVTQQVQQQIRAAMKDPALAAQAATLQEMWKVLASHASNYANVLDRINQAQVDKKMKEFAENWSSTLKDFPIAMEQLQKSFGKGFGKDFDVDSKSIDGAIKMYEKLYAKSVEGKKESADSKRAQIDDMESIFKVKEALLTAEIMIQTEQMRAVKATTEANAEARVREITSLRELGKVTEEEAVRTITAEVMKAAAVSKSMDMGIAAAEARMTSFRENMAKMLAAQDSIKTAFEKEANKGNKKPSDTSGKRDQSFLEQFIKQTQQARDEVEKLQGRNAELMDQMAGDSLASKIEKIWTTANAAIAKTSLTLTDMENKLKKMKGGDQKAAAQKEYEQLTLQIAKQQELIKGNAEIEEQYIRRERALQDIATAIQNAASKGDVEAYYRLQLEQVNLEMEKEAGNLQKIVELEERRRRLIAEQTSDPLANVEIGMQKWELDQKKEVANLWQNIMPNAINATTDAYTDLFANIISGTMSAKDAFQNWQQAIASMGKQIIQTLIQIAIKMLIVKAIESTMAALGGAGGAADGAVTSWGSQTISGSLLPGDPGFGAGAGLSVTPLASARGNAFDARGVTAFASGGVLPGPTYFAMNGGGQAVAGEAGPEAFVPLGRTREGKLGIETTGGQGMGGAVGTLMVVNVYNNASDKVSTSQQQGTDDQGNPRLDLFIDQIDSMLAGKVSSGQSALGKSIDKTRGTSPARALYV